MPRAASTTRPPQGARDAPGTGDVKAEGSSGDPEKSTRDRILDIALQLFIDKGFDKTSLREIADQLGFSKAAIYYHFASKEDILMALHLRLHEFGREALDTLGQSPVSPASWAALLDRLIDQMLEHRSLFLFHERNQAALEHLHKERHEADHDDLQADVFSDVSSDQLGSQLRGVVDDLLSPR
jgi:AcrR family transcriptional regulator